MRLLVLWTGLALLVGPAFAGTVLIAVNQEDRVMLIDDRDNKLLGSVAVGTGPHEIAVSPEGRRAYVADSGRGPNQPGNTITVIDIHRRGAIATWKLGEHSAHDVVVSSDGKLVWAACAATRAVLEIDSATGKTLKTWNTGREGGWMLTASADDRLVFVAHLETGGVTRIERSSGAVTHVPTPEGEMGFAITPDGKTLWAANSRDHQVREIAAEGGAGATFASGAKTPLRVRFTSDGKRGVITHADPPQLTVFEVASRKIVGRVALPQRPKIVALNAEGTRAYISHPEADSVSVVDLTKLAVIGSIKTGKQPDGVAYAP